MLEKLYSSAIDNLYFNLDEDYGFEFEFDYFDIFKSCSLLYELKFKKEADKLFIFILKNFDNNYNLKFTNKKKEKTQISNIYILELLLTKIEICQKEDNQKELKKVISLLENIVLKIDLTFDKKYLLIKNPINKNFILKENLIFLKYKYEICQILTESKNYNLLNKFEKITDLLEISILRYFVLKNENKIITKFNPDKKTYKLSSKNELIIYFNIYNFDNEILKKEIKQLKIEMNKITKVEVFLNYCYFLKMEKNGNFKNLIIDKFNELIEFPEKIENIKNYENIQGKLFNIFPTEKKLKNEKILINLINLKTINLIIEILKKD
jgi:hypothetical protein